MKLETLRIILYVVGILGIVNPIRNNSMESYTAIAIGICALAGAIGIEIYLWIRNRKK